MNTNYEAVVSLVELLVKKAGFDVHKDYSEVELEKTKNSISSLVKEKGHSKDKKTINSLIDNLKVRQANWENNAEIVGKSLIKAYLEGKDYESVKARIDLLGNLALKGTENVTVTSVYGELKKLNKDYEELKNKISNTSYVNQEEKEMDTKYKAYLENKLTSLDSEISSLDNELEGLREVEIKEVNIEAKIKEYAAKLKSDLDKIEKIVNSSINSDVTAEVWDKLEVARNETKEKLDKSNDLLLKTESMLEDVKKSKDSISERKNKFEIEKTRANTKLNNINTKLEEDKYDNNTLKMIDLNNSEIMRLQIEALNNKKDVIYVDALKVKEELIKEWNKGSGVNFTESPIEKEKTTQEEKTLEIDSSSPEEKIEELVKEVNDNKDIMDVVKEAEEILNKEEPPKVSKVVKTTLKSETLPSRKDILEEFQNEIDKASKDLEKLDLSKPNEEVQKPVKTITLDSEEEEIKKETDEVIDKIDSLISEETEKQEENNKMELDW